MGEGLENVDCAVLYDRVASGCTVEVGGDLSASCVVWNDIAREAMIRRISDIAKSVESYRGSPQDIEGAVVGDRIVLLQTRAQIC